LTKNNYELQKKTLYFDKFNINRIDLNFSLAARAVSSQHSIVRLLKTIALTIGNIDSVKFTFRPFTLVRTFDARSDFNQKVADYYKHHLLLQTFKIIGSFDFVGSPLTLFQNVGTGILDFFVQPVSELVFKGNLIKGIQKGTSSLIGRSLYGVFNSISRLSRSLGGIVATVIFSNGKYMKTRNSIEPRYFVDSIPIGIQFFLQSFKDSITGVVKEPFIGYQDGGILGATKGIVAGSTGLFTLLTLGAVDTLTTITTGIKNSSTKLFNKTIYYKNRPPRVFEKDGSFLLYSLRKSIGQYLLLILQKNNIAQGEVYKWHFDIQNRVNILTNRAFYHITLIPFTVIWRIDYSDIQTIDFQDNVIIINSYYEEGIVSLIRLNDKKEKVKSKIMKISNLR